MTRIVKDPETRRAEILSAAGELFRLKGYTNTTVDEIIQSVGVAKGTFYYYFKSKQEILSALVHEMVGHICINCQKIADDSKLGALEKLRQMLRGQNQMAEKESELMEDLHQAENRELHEQMNIEIILKVSPLFAQVIEQGKAEAVFNVDQPLETVQILLAGSQFLLESGLFAWTPAEQLGRIKAMQTMIEKSLGASPGSFAFLD